MCGLAGVILGKKRRRREEDITFAAPMAGRRQSGRL